MKDIHLSGSEYNFDDKKNISAAQYRGGSGLKNIENLFGDGKVNLKDGIDNKKAEYIFLELENDGIISDEDKEITEKEMKQFLKNHGQKTDKNAVYRMGTVINSITKFFAATKDGTIGRTEQQSTGDCWLLSGVNGLSYTEKGAQIIKEALEHNTENNGEKGTTVHLKGLNKDYFVSDSELEDVKNSSKMSLKYSKGDDDMIILEMAVEKARNEIANGDINFSDEGSFIFGTSDIYSQNATSYLSIRSGLTLESMYYLTGKAGESASDKDDMNNLLDNFMENNNKDYVLTASINSGGARKGVARAIPAKDGSTTVNLAGGHAYSIKSADKDTVTVINPHDSGDEVVLTREDFLEIFNRIYSLDLSDNNPEQDLTIKTTAETKKNTNGTTTKTIKDEDGNIIGKYLFDKDNNKISYETEDDIKTSVHFHPEDEIGGSIKRQRDSSDNKTEFTKTRYDKSRKIQEKMWSVTINNDDGTKTKKETIENSEGTYVKNKIFDKNNKIKEMSMDSDGDGKIDYIEKYKRNKDGSYKKKVDGDGDGKIDYVEYYNKDNELIKTKYMNNK